ncbi:hypothetical protein ACFX1Z_043686 [Malus domestica]
MPPSPIVGVEYVAELIVPETTSWNINLVKDLFPPDEAALILVTPLSCRLPPGFFFAIVFEGSFGVESYMEGGYTGSSSELALHVFKDCSFTREVYASSHLSLGLRNLLLWDDKVSNPALVSHLGVIALDSPLAGWMKVNVDGSFLVGSNIGGVGAVFRNKVDSYAGGFVVQAIGKRGQGSSLMELLVEDIHALLRVFVDSSVCYMRRTANVTAYSMAKLAISSSIDFCWYEEPLNSIVEALSDVA